MKKFLPMLMLAALPAACGKKITDVEILASSFPQNCQTDSDCVTVGSGNVCTDCICRFEAINKSTAPCQPLVEVVKVAPLI